MNIFCCNNFACYLLLQSESGKFLALDLGGTNFRVLLIELGEHISHMESKIFAVPQSIMLGTGVQVCDFSDYFVFLLTWE